MGREFDIEYDDFSGGYFVGTNESQQPMNTWVGTDVAVSPSTGHLIALPSVFSESSSLNSGLAFVGFFGVDSNDVIHWAGTTGTPPTFYYQNFGLTTTGSSAAAAGTAVKAGPVQFANKMCWALDAVGVGIIVARDVTTFALTNGNTPAANWLSTLGTYKYWLVGGDSTITNRMFFSAPNDPVTWAATDYIDIGSTSNTITGFVDAQDVLYIMTTGGLYSISGVLGSSSVLRQVNRVPLSDGTPFDTSVLGLTSNVAAGNYDGPLVMQGSTARRILQGAADASSVAQVGSAVAVVCNDSSVMFNDPMTSRAWYRRANLSGFSSLVPATVNRSEYAYFYPVSTGAQKVWRLQLNPTTSALTPSLTTFPTATVTLADYSSKRPFIIKDALMEVAIGEESAAAARSMGVQMGTLSVPAVGPDQFNGATSDAMLYQFTTEATTSLLAHKFNPNNAGPTYNVAPIVTLQGVELRRLVLRCQEV